jgi:hypothetical protein
MVFSRSEKEPQSSQPSKNKGQASAKKKKNLSELRVLRVKKNDKA